MFSERRHYYKPLYVFGCTMVFFYRLMTPQPYRFLCNFSFSLNLSFLLLMTTSFFLLFSPFSIQYTVRLSAFRDDLRPFQEKHFSSPHSMFRDPSLFAVFLFYLILVSQLLSFFLTVHSVYYEMCAGVPLRLYLTLKYIHVCIYVYMQVTNLSLKHIFLSDCSRQ